MRRVGSLKSSSRARLLHVLVYREPIRISKHDYRRAVLQGGAAKLGGDLWNSGQRSSAPNASSPSFQEQASATSASRFQARRATSSSTAGLGAVTAGRRTSRRAHKSRNDRKAGAGWELDLRL